MIIKEDHRITIVNLNLEYCQFSAKIKQRNKSRISRVTPHVRVKHVRESSSTVRDHATSHIHSKFQTRTTADIIEIE